MILHAYVREKAVSRVKSSEKSSFKKTWNLGNQEISFGQVEIKWFCLETHTFFRKFQINFDFPLTKIPTHCANRSRPDFGVRARPQSRPPSIVLDNIMSRDEPCRNSCPGWTRLEIRARQYSGKPTASFREKFLALARFLSYIGGVGQTKGATMVSILATLVIVETLFTVIVSLGAAAYKKGK